MLKSIRLRKQILHITTRLYNIAFIPNNGLPNTIKKIENKTLDIIVLRHVVGPSLDAQESEINPSVTPSTVLAGDPKCFTTREGIQAEVLEKWNLRPKSSRSCWLNKYVYTL